MNTETTFIYNYSAKESAEVQAIRKKYLPQAESKLDELKRLDEIVQSSGTPEALCVGIGGALVFGLGMCLAMQILATSVFAVIFGIVLGLVGMCGMLIAYPVYRKVYGRAKEKYAPRILELTEELSKENNF